MRLKYAICLAKFFHYTNSPDLEDIITAIRELGYGVELWREVWREDKDLFSKCERRNLRNMLRGMDVSIHSNGADTLDTHKFQIDAAADIGASILVMHSNELFSADRQTLDIGLATEVVDFAKECGVTIALENLLSRNELDLLVDAVSRIRGLGVCLDTSHVYFTDNSLQEYMDALNSNIIHLHLQDVLPEPESGIPYADRNNYIPGSGGIPQSDWRIFATKLQHLDYDGMAVFETKPRNPFQAAFLGKTFIQRMFGS